MALCFVSVRLNQAVPGPHGEKTDRMSKINQLAFLLSFFILFLPVLLRADEAAASHYYERAVVLVEQGDLKGAIIELKNALQEDSDLLAARVLQGKVYVLLEQGGDAEKQFRDAHQLGADRSLTLVPMAKAYLLQKKYKQLLDDINPDGQPRTVQSELYAYRGHALLELQDTGMAMDAFKTSERLNPDNGLAFTGQAMVLLRQGTLDEATSAAARATLLAPGNADAWNVMASISHAKGELDRAVKEYSEAIILKPEHLDARVARVGIYIDQKRYPEAAADLDYLRKEFSKEPQSAYLQGVLYAQQGERELSVQAFRESADLVDLYKDSYLEGNEKLLMLAGLVNFDLGRNEKAQHYLGKYLKRYPGRPGVRKLLGSILMRQGEFDRALVTLTPALDYSPNDIKLYSMLGVAYMNTGQHTRANTMLEKAVELSNGDPELRTRLALNHLKAGNQKRAIEQLTAVFEQDNRQIHAGIALAQTYLEIGELDKALQVARKLSNLQPDNTRLLNLLGSAQVRKGMNREARETFEKALQLSPEFIQAHHSLGKLDILERNMDAARLRYAAVLEKQPNHIATMIEMARLEDVQGRDQDAIRWLEKARSISKDSIETSLYLVDLYIRTGNPGVALEIAREAEQATSKNMEVLAASARANLAMGKPGIARVTYRRMVSLAGFNPEVLYQTSAYQIDAGFLDDAIFTLHQALSTHPDHLPVQIRLVQTLLQANRVEEADDPASKLRTQYPQRAFGHRLVGDVLMRQKKYKEAEKSYQAALARDENTRHAILVYQAKSRAGDQQGAAGFLEQWIQSHPEDQVARMALAEESLRAGRLSEAAAHYERVLKEHPQVPDILNNLANIYYRLDDQRALGTAEKAHALAPEDVSINDTLGWILANQGQAERSLRYLRDAHYRDSGNPEIRYHIAFALVKLGRRDEAKRELETALDSGKPFDGIEEARKLQQELGK